jgi:hypothetical protein
MNDLKEMFDLILGEKSLGYYGACLFFSSIAMLIMLRVGAAKRNPASPRTPDQFSWTFLIVDNIWKAATTYMLLFLGYRFMPEMQMVWAVGMGFAASAGVVFLLNSLAEFIPGFKKFIQFKNTPNVEDKSI